MHLLQPGFPDQFAAKTNHVFHEKFHLVRNMKLYLIIPVLNDWIQPMKGMNLKSTMTRY
jgi:hypothetical protein